MKRGRIIGEVWGTRRAAGLDGRRLVLVRDGASERVVVAVDTLDARVGQEALVAFGSGARNVLASGEAQRAVLADAAIALLVDGASSESADGEPQTGAPAGED